MTDRVGRWAAIVGTWALLRALFFEGFWGYDDLYHVRFALEPGVPRDVWEARLLYNGFLIASERLFGSSELALALPTLAGSLAFVVAAAWTAQRLAGQRAALVAGLLAAALPLDVTHATDPMANAFGNGFAAWGAALVLTSGEASGARARRRLLGAAALLAAAMLAHLTFAYFAGTLALALALRRDLRRDWSAGLLLMGATLGFWFAADAALFTAIAGDPLHHFTLLKTTHLDGLEGVYTMPRRNPDGSPSLAWWLWPLHTAVFSKAFGFVLSVPLVVALVRWRERPDGIRLAALALVLFWLQIGWGTQHPLDYAPLDHQTRYWYPAALLGCVLAGHLVASLRAPRLRYGAAAALGAPLVLLLLASGSWGRNVDVTRELMAHADRNPTVRFVTDPYTYDEMYVLRGLRRPENVTLLSGQPEPAFAAPPPEARLSPEAAPMVVLVNEMHHHRPNARPFAEWLAEGFTRRPVSEPTWRTLARLLPERVRSRVPALVRKPPAYVAERAPRVPDPVAGAAPP